MPCSSPTRTSCFRVTALNPKCQPHTPRQRHRAGTTLPAQEGRRTGERQVYLGRFWTQPADKEKCCEATLVGAVLNHDAGEPGQRCPQAGWYGPRCHSAPQSSPEPGRPLPHSRAQGAACGGEGSGAAPASRCCRAPPPAAEQGGTFRNLRGRAGWGRCRRLPLAARATAGSCGRGPALQARQPRPHHQPHQESLPVLASLSWLQKSLA